MKKITLAALAIAGLVSGASAFAAEDGMYILGGLGQTTAGDKGRSAVDDVLTTAGGSGFSSSMDTPTLYKLQVGYQLDKNWSLEGGYLGSNKVTYSASGGNLPGTITSSVRLNGWNITGVGALPLGNGFSLLGKLGVANVQESATAQGGGFSSSTDGSKLDATYGIGAKYDFTSAVFARLDLDRYSIGNSISANRDTVWMMDIGYKF